MKLCLREAESTQTVKQSGIEEESFWQSLKLQPMECLPGERNGNPLQYPCLENLMDTGAWWAAVHRVAKSWARLSD